MKRHDPRKPTKLNEITPANLVLTWLHSTKSHSSRLIFVGLLIAMTLGLSRPVSAQDTVTGAFEGIVSDSQTGAPLKGAAIDIINQQTGLTISLHTDYRGRFYQGLLIPGIYKVRVELPGYQTREVFQRLKITYTGEVVPVPLPLDPSPPATSAATPAPPPPLGQQAQDLPSTTTRPDGPT